MARADVGDRRERIDGARVDRACARRDRHRPDAVGEIALDGRLELVDAHAVPLVHADRAGPALPDPEELGPLPDRAVRLRARVDRERGPAALEAVASHRAVGGHVACYSQGRQRRRRAAADEQPHRAGRQPDELPEPADHLPLEPVRGVVPAGDARVHRGREGVGEDPDRRGRRVDPAPVARMPLAEMVRRHAPLELVEDLVDGRARLGKRRRQELRRSVGREERECRRLRQLGQVSRDDAGDAPADALELFRRPLPTAGALRGEIETAAHRRRKRRF